MEIVAKLKYSILILLLIILIAGCSLGYVDGFVTRESTALIQDVPVTITIATIDASQANQFPSPTNTQMGDSMSQGDEISKCNWPPLKIADYASAFYWTLDSRLLVFTEDVEQGEWFAYDFESKQVKSYIQVEPYNVYHERGQLTLEEIKAIAIKFNVKEYVQLYESPDMETSIYGIVDDLKYYQLYSKKIGDREPTYLGKIRGNIDDVYWFKDGMRALLAIDWQSAQGIGDGYVYLVDLAKNIIEIVIPADPIHSEIKYLGITPDETRILFVTYSGHDRSVHLWEISNDEVQKTNLPAPLTFHWLPNGVEMVGIIWGQELQVFRYNIQDQRIGILADHPLPAGNWSYGVKFSPNLKYIGFLHESDSEIYVLDCSNVNLQ
jgi:hypothetical protein